MVFTRCLLAEGEVDITNGKFVFSASEAYLIEDGQVTTPVKGATLIGDGPTVLTRVTAVGNDLKLDPGIGHVREGRSERPRGCRDSHHQSKPADRGGNVLREIAVISVMENGK